MIYTNLIQFTSNGKECFHVTITDLHYQKMARGYGDQYGPQRFRFVGSLWQQFLTAASAN